METEITINGLPSEVKESILKSISGSIKKIYKIDNEGIISYRIILSKWFQEKEVYYDSRGTILR